jgi:hypothetical protein
LVARPGSDVSDVKVKVEVAAIVGQFLDPHGLVSLLSSVFSSSVRVSEVKLMDGTVGDPHLPRPSSSGIYPPGDPVRRAPSFGKEGGGLC